MRVTPIFWQVLYTYSNKCNNGTMYQSIYIYIYICYRRWTSIVVVPAMEQCVSLPEDSFIQQKGIVYDSSDSVALSRVLAVSTSITIRADHCGCMSRTLNWIVTYMIIKYTHACNRYILISIVHVYSNKYNNGTMYQSIYIYMIL